MVKPHKHRHAAKFMAKNDAQYPGLNKEIMDSIEQQVRNTLEPDKAFVSEVVSPVAVFPMNFSITKNIDTLQSTQFGYALVRPALDKTFAQSSLEGGFVPQLQPESSINEGQVLEAGVPYYIREDIKGLSQFEEETLGVSFDDDGNPFYEGEWDATAPASANPAVTIHYNVVGPYDGTWIFSGHSKSGPQGTPHEIAANTSLGTTAVMNLSEYIALSGAAGFSIAWRPNVIQQDMRLSIEYTDVEVDSAFLQEESSLEDLIEDQESAALVEKALMWRISAMSFLLKNTTPDLVKGGNLVASILPPGVEPNLPNDPEEMFNFLGKLNTYSKKDMKLSEGAHLSNVPGVVYNKKFKPISDRGDPEQLPVMAVAWKRADNPIGNGFSALALTGTIKINLEIQTVTQGLPLRTVHPELNKIHKYIETSMYTSYLDMISTNDGHGKKITRLAKRVVKDPKVQRIAKDVGKKGLKAALAILSTMVI